MRIFFVIIVSVFLAKANADDRSITLKGEGGVQWIFKEIDGVFDYEAVDPNLIPKGKPSWGKQTLANLTIALTECRLDATEGTKLYIFACKDRPNDQSCEALRIATENLAPSVDYEITPKLNETKSPVTENNGRRVLSLTGAGGEACQIQETDSSDRFELSTPNSSDSKLLIMPTDNDLRSKAETKPDILQMASSASSFILNCKLSLDSAKQLYSFVCASKEGHESACHSLNQIVGEYEAVLSKSGNTGNTSTTPTDPTQSQTLNDTEEIIGPNNENTQIESPQITEQRIEPHIEPNQYAEGYNLPHELVFSLEGGKRKIHVYHLDGNDFNVIQDRFNSDGTLAGPGSALLSPTGGPGSAGPSKVIEALTLAGVSKEDIEKYFKQYACQLLEGFGQRQQLGLPDLSGITQAMAGQTADAPGDTIFSACGEAKSYKLGNQSVPVDNPIIAGNESKDVTEVEVSVTSEEEVQQTNTTSNKRKRMKKKTSESAEI